MMEPPMNADERRSMQGFEELGSWSLLRRLFLAFPHSQSCIHRRSSAFIGGSIPHRRGFTLIEMLVVLTIIAAIAGITLPIMTTMLEGGRVRDTARTIQAMLASARDRAMSAGEPRGVRFVQEDDPNTPSGRSRLVRSMVYVEPVPPIILGLARVVDSTGSATTPVYNYVQITGGVADQFTRLPKGGCDPNGFGMDGTGTLSAARISQLKLQDCNDDGTDDTTYVRWQFKGVIRFNKSGPLLPFGTNESLLAMTPLTLVLDEPLDHRLPEGSGATTTDGVEYEVPLGSVPLPDSDPTPLPGGVVIDLSLSRIALDDATGLYDLLIGPDGRVVGSAAVNPHIAVWIRDENGTGARLNSSRSRYEVESGSTGNHVLVTLYSQTGYVTASDPLFLDTDNDGWYDFDRYFENVERGSGSGL